MNLTATNHLVSRLFNPQKQGRINDMNARIAGEAAISPRTNIGAQRRFASGDTSMMGLSTDEAFAMLNPNHIKGLVTYHGQQPDRRILDLPDHMREAMITFAREDFTRNFGGSRDSVRSGERQTMLQHSFLREIPVQDRQAASWTLSRMRGEESRRIEAAVREVMPNWQIGQRVPDEILRPILNGAGSFDTTG